MSTTSKAPSVSASSVKASASSVSAPAASASSAIASSSSAIASSVIASSTKASSTKASTTKHKSSSTASSTAIVTAGTKGLGTTTTVILAVVVSVVGIVLLFLLYRFVSHRRNRRSANPLPPVQPIAHHREQHLYQFEESKYNSFSGSANHSNRGTWYGGQHHLAAPSPEPSRSASDASLVNKEADPFLSSAPPSPGFSPGFTRASDQSLGSHARKSFENTLPPPAPAFHGDSAGSSRSSTPVSGSPSGHPDSVGTYFAPPQHPLAESSSARNSPRRSRSPAQAGYPIRPRPTSMVSTTSRVSRGPSTARGAPHGPHRNVQIMLPAPLASGLSPYEREGLGERGSHMSTLDNRKSVVDQWAGVGQQREEPLRLPEDKKRKVSKRVSARASSAASDARLSTASSHSSLSSNNPNNPFASQNAPAPQRSQAQVYSSSPLSISREPSSPPSAFSAPPLPAMPAIYNRFADVERGRQMGETALASPVEQESAIERRRSGSRDRSVFYSPSTATRANSRTRPQT